MELPPPSEEDTHFIINQIKDFNFTTLQNSLRNNRSNASNQTNNYDVMNQSQHALTNENALRHCQRGNRLRSMYTSKFQMDKNHCKQLTSNSDKISHTIPSISSVIDSNKYNIIQTINVITRKRHQIETSTRPIYC